MERLPRSLAIAGGGTIGCEYACLFKVLGLDEVRVINSGERILPFADHEISTMLREVMESLGIEFHMSDRVERVDATPALTLQLLRANSSSPRRSSWRWAPAATWPL
jgi:pyruvate/2-oxoglutarate dehydrogenase complex dihydrolipoamide dehydrogenase (E3) component